MKILDCTVNICWFLRRSMMDKNDGLNKKAIFLLFFHHCASYYVYSLVGQRVYSAEPLWIGTVQISDGLGTWLTPAGRNVCRRGKKRSSSWTGWTTAVFPSTAQPPWLFFPTSGRERQLQVQWAESRMCLSGILTTHFPLDCAVLAASPQGNQSVCTRHRVQGKDPSPHLIPPPLHRQTNTHTPIQVSQQSQTQPSVTVGLAIINSSLVMICIIGFYTLT